MCFDGPIFLCFHLLKPNMLWCTNFCVSPSETSCVLVDPKPHVFWRTLPLFNPHVFWWTQNLMFFDGPTCVFPLWNPHVFWWTQKPHVFWWTLYLMCYNVITSVPKIESKNFFFASWISSVKFAFFSMSFCGKWAWPPPGHATPFSFWLQIAEIMSFLLMYCLFLYYQRFFQNIEKR